MRIISNFRRYKIQCINLRFLGFFNEVILGCYVYDYDYYDYVN
jgi:hypothetical protein